MYKISDINNYEKKDKKKRKWTKIAYIVEWNKMVKERIEKRESSKWLKTQKWKMRTKLDKKNKKKTLK